MNHKKIYDNLIQKAKERNYYSKKYKIGLVKTNLYLETHHIIPKCLGGDDSENNLVVLTLKEHFIAHLLLCKLYPNSPQIANAFCIMLNKTPDKNAKSYSKYKQIYIEYLKTRTRETWSKERLEAARSKGLELARNPEYLRKVSEGVNKAYNETDLRKKVSEASKKAWQNEEYRDNQIKKLKERTSKEDYKKKISDLRKQENINNPELKQKRIEAIKKHMYNKSEDWIAEQTEIITKRMNSPEWKQKYRDKYYGSNFDRSRKVIDTETKQIYSSAVEASKVKNLNVSTVKKYLYKNNKKHNLQWLDLYEENK